MYIKDISCISPQYTYDNGIWENKVKVNAGTKFKAIEPDYSNIIASNMLRRMGKATRMAIGTGLRLIKRNADLGGIIIGTANGGFDDCMKFLNQIETYDEGTLTPTNFVQSTPNSIGGILSIMGDNHGYNATHVHNGLAFENALLDARLFLEENETASILTGCVDEISDYNFNIEEMAGNYKNESVDTNSLLKSGTKGTVSGEGSAMFIIDSSLENSFSQINDINHFCYPEESDIVENIKHFLGKNNLTPKDVNALMLGLNGDSRTDYYYHNVHSELFKEQGIFSFKNLVGEYPTATAFAVYLSNYILQGYKIPDNAIFKTIIGEIKNILIYNHSKGIQHSLILISSTLPK